MLGHLYDRALGGERCWIRHEDGEIRVLPAHRWLGGRRRSNGSGASGDAFDEVFDEAVTQMCTGPTIELGCGPGRLVASLIQRGIPALDIDRSATAIRLAGHGGAPALLGDVPRPSPASGWGPRTAGECAQPGMGLWQTVLLVDGNIGLGGDPRRISGARRRPAGPPWALRCRVRRRGHRYPCTMGASRVGQRCWALVPMGIGRCGQRSHAGRASEPDVDQRPSDRQSGDYEPGGLVNPL
jgi:hypothetical protein